MKRILFLTFYFRPDLCAGSFRNSPLLDELSRQTKDKNIQIDVLTTIPNRYSTFNHDYQKKESFDNVHIERIDIPEHKSGMADQALSFKSYFFETLKRTKSKNYDLVYGSSSRFFTSYLAYRVAKNQRCPLYIDVRDIFSETLADISNNVLIRHALPPVISVLENRVYKYATHINLISEGFKESFKDYTSTEFSYFSHGVDPMFLNSPEEMNAPESAQKKKILYAGNVGEGQGLHKIIPEAAKKIEKTHQFEIIGDGGAMDKLKSALEDLNVQNVHIKEPVEREKLVDIYYDADILFIHLNNYKIFEKVLPSKIFELAVIGKPILAGVNGYSESFLKKHVDHSYIFPPCNHEKMLNKISEIEQSSYQINPSEIEDFKKKFDRGAINSKMAESIINTLKP